MYFSGAFCGICWISQVDLIPGGVGAVVRSLPPNPEAPGLTPGLVEGWIFGWLSFMLKFIQLSILPGSVKWVPAYTDRFEAAARGAYICFRSAGSKLIIVKTHANGRNKSQHCWAQQCWELLALVAWCMQTNTTTANIVGLGRYFGLNNSPFCPKRFLYVYTPSHVFSSNNSLYLTHRRGKSFPRGQSTVPPRGLTIFSTVAGQIVWGGGGANSPSET